MADFSNKVIYQIYPKSFKDSNGDGIGDLRGVAEKLDYLKDLGVDYLWLTPFFVSPQRDNGYDVADYRNIDPMFGTMEDLDNLIAEGEKRNIGLMFDMVFNHTSTSHEWFRRALAGEKKYQDYYIFKEGAPDQPPTNWQSKFGGSAWEYVSSLGKWYLHLFDVTQADLNWKNPEVREELKEVIRFWKAKGRLLWKNLHWIFWMSLIPMATEWMGLNPYKSLPALFYGIILFMCAVSYNIVQAEVIKINGKDSQIFRNIGNDLKGKLSIIAYAAAIIFAFYFPVISYLIYIAIALTWIVPDSRLEKA